MLLAIMAFLVVTSEQPVGPSTRSPVSRGWATRHRATGSSATGSTGVRASLGLDDEPAGGAPPAVPPCRGAGGRV